MGIIDTAKDLVSLVQKADNIDLTNKVLELQNQLLELVQDRWDMQKEVERLRRQIGELESEKGIREKLTFAHNVYWRGDPEAGGDGPYCIRCWDQTTRLARMLDYGNGYAGCPTCHTTTQITWQTNPSGRTSLGRRVVSEGDEPEGYFP